KAAREDKAPSPGFAFSEATLSRRGRGLQRALFAKTLRRRGQPLQKLRHFAAERLDLAVDALGGAVDAARHAAGVGGGIADARDVGGDLGGAGGGFLDVAGDLPGGEALLLDRG